MTERADNFIKTVAKVGSYAFDIEHDPDWTAYDAGFELAGVSFATKDIAFYSTDKNEYSYIVKTLFKTDAEAIAYNGKYDMKCLTGAGIVDTYEYPSNFCDPMVAVNLLDESRIHGQLGLKSVVYDQYGHEMVKFEESIAHGLNSPEFCKYAREDAYWEYRLWHDLRPALHSQNLWGVFSKILMQMSKVAADMEWVGVGWDIDGARKLLHGFQEFREKMEEEIVHEIGVLNLASGDQLAKRLYDELGYSTRGIEMTTSGKRFSTDSKAMEQLAKKYPVCEKIMRYRTATKMLSTYIEPLTRMAMNDPNGRVHPTLWLVSSTGRSRMEKPNFQNIPAWLDKSFAHLNIRGNIVPRAGNKFIVADLSQIELRLCAHVSQDPEFLRAYQQWQCKKCGETGTAQTILHKCPKCGEPEDERVLKIPHLKSGFWHGLDLHQMTTDDVAALGGDRQAGKMCNFALIYCATAPRLHYEYPKFSMKEWQNVIDDYFEKYKGIRHWHMRMQNLMYNGGTCTDIFGRKRRLKKKDIQKSAKHALNQFVNFPVQASACEYIQLTMANLRKECMKDKTWMDEIILSNFVHDELVCEVPENLVDKFVPRIVHHMENSVQFTVPIRTDVTIADNWGECK